MKKKKYMVNPYLVFMSGVAMALATPMVAGIIYWMWRDYNAANVDKLNDFIFVTVGFGSLYLMLPVHKCVRIPGHSRNYRRRAGFSGTVSEKTGVSV